MRAHVSPHPDPSLSGASPRPRNFVEEEDQRVIDELNAAAGVLGDPDSVELGPSATSAKRRETVTVPVGATNAGDPNFRWDVDEHGHHRQVHVGMNRKQRRANAKQQELALRKQLKTISKNPAKAKELARRIAAAAAARKG